MRKLPQKVYLSVAALNLQAFPLFRSIIEDCKRGEGYSASIICRSLFETYLALTFILKPKVRARTSFRREETLEIIGCLRVKQGDLQ